MSSNIFGILKEEENQSNESPNEGSNVNITTTQLPLEDGNENPSLEPVSESESESESETESESTSASKPIRPIPIKKPSCPKDDPNPIHCMNGGTCALGPTDFGYYSQFPPSKRPFEMNLHALPLSLHNNHHDHDDFIEFDGDDNDIDSDDNNDLGVVSLYALHDKHCNCPTGFTGVLCHIPVEICHNDDEEHDAVCFYGGKCNQAATKQHDSCDCHDENENLIALGAFCQHKVSMTCQYASKSKQKMFCTHHGKCVDEIETMDGQSHSQCLCEPGFSGTHCEEVHDIVPHSSMSPPSTSTTTTTTTITTNPPLDENIEEEEDDDDIMFDVDDAMSFHQDQDSKCPMSHELKCQNGGTCVIGNANFDIYMSQKHIPASMMMTARPIPNPSQVSPPHFEDFDDDVFLKEMGMFPDSSTHNNVPSVNGMYCECPSGFTGHKCEHEVQVCGDHEFYCFHGGTCLPKQSKNNTTTDNDNDNDNDLQLFTCQCEDSRLKNNPAIGEACEHLISSSCEVNEEISHHAFCTNGGVCVEMVHAHEQHVGCKCPSGWKGHHCEILMEEQEEEDDLPTNQNTSESESESQQSAQNDKGNPVDTVTKLCPDDSSALPCLHDGVCLLGSPPAPPSIFAMNVDDDDDNANVDDSIKMNPNIPFSMMLSNNDMTNKDGMFCQCSKNYAGPVCEYKVEICGQHEDVCFHGGTCISNASSKTGYSCDCHKDKSVRLATKGDHCQHIATSSCEWNEEFSQTAFCTNGGICKEMVDSGSVHAGCDCKVGFSGQHCEIVDTAKALNPWKKGHNGEIIGITFGVIAFILLPLFMFILRRTFHFDRTKRRQRKQQMKRSNQSERQKKKNKRSVLKRATPKHRSSQDLDVTLDADGGTMPARTSSINSLGNVDENRNDPMKDEPTMDTTEEDDVNANINVGVEII